MTVLFLASTLALLAWLGVDIPGIKQVFFGIVLLFGLYFPAIGIFNYVPFAKDQLGNIASLLLPALSLGEIAAWRKPLAYWWAARRNRY